MPKKPNPDDFTIPPCDLCKAKCCSYVAIEIDRPTAKKDYDHIRWYLLHKNVNVFIDHDRVWHVEFATRCESLSDENLCTQYETRPEICRKHGWPVGSCEFFDSPYLHYFSNIRQFERYLDKKGIDWRFKKHGPPKSPKTVSGRRGARSGLR